MNNLVSTCDRCDSKIVEQSHSRQRPHEFVRYPGTDEIETDDAKLCSMCLDDIWEFVFDADIDRSEKADPIPLERVSGSVERHIEDLEEIIDTLDSHAGGGDE